VQVVFSNPWPLGHWRAAASHLVQVVFSNPWPLGHCRAAASHFVRVVFFKSMAAWTWVGWRAAASTPRICCRGWSVTRSARRSATPSAQSVRGFGGLCTWKTRCRHCSCCASGATTRGSKVRGAMAFDATASDAMTTAGPCGWPVCGTAGGRRNSWDKRTAPN
jgi:hypothetical protein